MSKPRKQHAIVSEFIIHRMESKFHRSNSYNIPLRLKFRCWSIALRAHLRNLVGMIKAQTEIQLPSNALRRAGLLILFLIFYAHAFGQKVYVTKTGEKYHADSCRFLSKSKIAIDLDDAIKKNYTACSVCEASEMLQSSLPLDSLNNTTQSVQCSGKTQSGTRCKRTTKNSNGRCYQH